MKKDTSILRRMTICGVLAALYAALTLSTAAFAFGPIQFRIADALCVLPFFMPFTSVGLFIGCLIANIFSTVSALDIVIGSLATLIGCLGAARMPNKWLSPLPTIAANTVLSAPCWHMSIPPTPFFRALSPWARRSPPERSPCSAFSVCPLPIWSSALALSAAWA